MANITFSEMLVTDVTAALARYEKVKSATHMRDVVRTSFAAIEGTFWIFREHIIDTAKSTFGLQPDEISILDESTYQVSENGKISAQKRFIPLLNAIRLVARIAKRLAPAKQIDFSGRDWENLRQAISIRNRITHPKSADDLVLDAADVELCLQAMFWFLQETTEVMEGANHAIKDYLGQFQDVLQKLQSGHLATVALYDAICSGEE